MKINEICEKIGVKVPEILLPNKGIDMKKWAVVACDQFTSQPEYWEEVNKIVGDSPSTLRLFLPEVYLHTKEMDSRIAQINKIINNYTEDGTLVKQEPFMIALNRIDSVGKSRKGIVLAIDLEKYDYTKGASTLVRATEKTILDRIPPRVKVRKDAKAEFPHIMVLIDDPKRTVIEPVLNKELEKIYNFDLMMGGGTITGYKVDKTTEEQVINALNNLTEPTEFKAKYNLKEDLPVLLFAMGDGNHSLATAKAIWEEKKKSGNMNDPARWALVEIVNVHDNSLSFEPIHRVLFGLKKDFLKDFEKYCEKEGVEFDIKEFSSNKEALSKFNELKKQEGKTQYITYIQEDKYGIITLENCTSNLAVGSLQKFIDDFMADGAKDIDYIHGEDVVEKLGSQKGNIGFYLPHMVKSDLFKTVILDGSLPRKTFSMGHAADKRYYIEGRMIV